MAIHMPSQKRLKLELNHNKLIVTQVLTSLTKREIDSERVSNFKELLDNKFRRFEIRKNKSVILNQENIKAKISWTCLLIIAAVSGKVRKSVQVKKFLKKKNFNKWKVIRRFIRSYVQFLKIFKLVRERFALALIRRKLGKYAKDWVRIMKALKRKAIFNCVKRFLNGNVLAKFFKELRDKVRYLQGQLMFLVKVRRRVYQYLLACWEVYEKEFVAAGNKCEEVPIGRKIEIFRRFLKNKVRMVVKGERERLMELVEGKGEIFWTQPKEKRFREQIYISRLFNRQVFWSIIRQSQKGRESALVI